MATNIGPRIGVDGEAEYRKQMANIVAQAKALDSEMKALSASFGKNTTAQEKNSATSKVLTQQIAVQRKALSELQEMYDKAVSKYGAGSTEALKYKNEINKVTAELNRMENQLADTESGLDDMDNALDDVGDGLDGAGKNAVSFGDLLKANVIGDAIINGVKKLASTVKDMAGDFITAAADIKAETAQFEQTFGDLEETATKNLEEIGNAAGILPTRLRSAYTQLYAYAKSSGMDSAQALEFATKATYAAADAAAYYDRSLEEATEQVLAYTKGNYANDAALGFASTEATRNAQAIKSLGKKYKDLDVTAGETTKVLLDQIIASQELSGAAGQASREMDGWENVTGNLTESWRNFQATAGKPFLENLIPLVQKGAKYLSDFEKSIDWDQFSSKVDKAFQKGENFAKSAVNMGKQVLPAFGKAVGFVADHFQSLTKVAIGAYTAVKVLKGISSVTSVVSGFQKAVQTSTVAMSAAQKGMQLLNLTMSANVFGAVAAAAAVLVAGIAALVAIEGQAKTAAEEEAEASKKVAEASKEQLAAYQETMDAADKQAAADTAQIAHANELWQELQKLADETGKVQEADQARAEFILGELNSALGTEYEMTGNQIENYQDLTAAIGDMIEKKRAQILLDAHEAEYREAITKRTELEKEQVQVTGELAAAKENLSQKEAEYKKISEEVIRQSQSGTRDIDAALQAQAVSLAREVSALKENVQAKQEAYNSNEQLIRTYYKNITQYEQASTAAMEGDTQKVIDILDQQNAAFIYAADLSGRTQFEQRQILEKQYKDAEQAFELVYQRWQDGVEGITADTIAEARRNADAARAEFEQMGVNMTDGIANGILRAKPGLNATINNLINGAIASANAAMNAHSPSRRFADEVGENIPSGVAVGVEKNTKVLNSAVGSMIDDSITQLRGLNYTAQLLRTNMVREFSAGNAIKNMPDGIRFPLNVMNSVPAGTNAGGNRTTNLGGVNIQVYGAQGQDVNELADIILYKAQNEVNRREAVFG